MRREKGGDTLFKKKQVAMILSFVLISFLVGTSVASDGGNPWKKVWEAIYGLQGRVDSIEERLNQQAKTIRFLDSTEIIESGAKWNDTVTLKNATTFTWIPNNISNNAILSLCFYMEYKGVPYPESPFMSIYFGIWVVSEQGVLRGESRSFDIHQATDYASTHVLKYRSDLPKEVYPKPNQPFYELILRYWVIGGTAYMKNFNFIVTVADGISPEQ